LNQRLNANHQQQTRHRRNQPGATNMTGQIRSMTHFRTQLAKARANKRVEALNGGGWVIRRMRKNGKPGAIYKHWQTGQSEFNQQDAEAEVARLCKLNGEGAFIATAI
jgi:hypothetical protein